MDDKDSPADPISKQSASAKILRDACTGPQPKCVVGTWLGCGWKIAGWVHDPTYFSQFRWAWLKRLALAPPKWDHKMADEFRHFASVVPKLWYPNRLDPLVTFREWLDEKKGYSARRKIQLWEAYLRHGGDPQICLSLPRATWNEIFIKREMYMEWKFPRIISSRSDYFKTLAATFFNRVDKILFQSENFIKLVPVSDRPAVVERMLGGTGLCATTDFKSWESCIQGLLQYAEIQLYRWLGRDLPHALIDAICETVGGVQHQRNRNGFKAKLQGRQSGDMCTSCGNGYINLLVCSFAAWKVGWIPQFTRINGLFEGDDGIYSVGENWREFKDVLGKCGVRVGKMEVHPNPGSLGFLSTYWCKDLVPLSDFRRYIVKTPWALEKVESPRVRMELLRAKGLSLACAAAGCPVLSAYARMIIRNTQGHVARYRNDATSTWWTTTVMGELYGHSEASDDLLARLNQPIPFTRRAEYCRLFDIGIVEQIMLEKALDAHTGVGELDYSLVAPYLDPAVRARWFYQVVRPGPRPMVSRTPAGLTIQRHA